MDYLESVAMPKRAAVCAVRMAGFSSKFDPAFARWLKENSATLQDGENFLRQAAAAQKMDFDTHVGAVTDTDAALLKSAPQALVEENCNALLRRLGGQ